MEKNKNKLDTPVLYIYLYKKIKEKAGPRKVMGLEEIFQAINTTLYHVPKIYRYLIVKELEQYGFIKRLDRFSYESIVGEIEVNKKLNEIQAEKILKKIHAIKFEITGGKRDLELAKHTYPLWG